MNRTLSICLFLILFGFQTFAQSAGENIYEFLNLGSSARVAALGGDQVALGNVDADYAFYNPAALHPELDQSINLNYVSYLADINYGYASYTKSYKKIGTFSLGMHYVNYGKFTEADELGDITGNFKASDYALFISYGKQINENVRIGVTLKPIYSSLEKYNSFGLATDMAVIYDSSDKLFRAALVARNFGYQVKPYYGSHREDLPNEVLIGLSTKLQHAPFRFALTYRHLEKFDQSYQSELNQVDDSFSNQSSEDGFVEKALKHVILGAEFLPTKNFSVRLGYNFQRRDELSVEEKKSTVGFTWGFGFKISRFRINFASAKYHLAGSSNHFSVSTRLSDFNFR
ncbi:type IX secretion system protein PorQ [Marinifilum caeruleilacunae]|uniref:Type IX secretion system protein PorQ n=1 Tax=Marinifilum caeruleilacunae TaxID=2499076 RepID=A0ABX1WRN5_9BACT|nr:type IX secretion system protein PorQ [Marinifilum caeruleilacunae]NOU58750.1 type IX secretion system protein PorQ [Marinifilum caeruleilacunae]